jgi:hypothetical protein
MLCHQKEIKELLVRAGAKSSEFIGLRFRTDEPDFQFGKGNAKTFPCLMGEKR